MSILGSLCENFKIKKTFWVWGNLAKAGGRPFRKCHFIMMVYELRTSCSYFGASFDQKTSKTFFLGVV